MKKPLAKLSPAESRWMDWAREIVIRQHKALSTERAYLYRVHQYLLFLRGLIDKSVPSEDKVGAFLSLHATTGISKSTHGGIFSALLWFYKDVLKQPLKEVNALRVKRGERVRYAPGFADTMRFLGAVEDSQSQPYRLILHMLYGMGLRITECMELRLRDIDCKQWRIFIHAGKHDKDRIVEIPENLREPLRFQIARAEAVWEWDRRQRVHVPVSMPGALGRKWPKAAYSRNWFWLFPAEGYCNHPRTGERVRWRLHHASVQRAARRAATEIGMEGLITPHCLRHSFATHALERGNNIKAVSDWMGHANINTTAGYIHAHIEDVTSPIEAMAIDLPVVTVPANVVAFQQPEKRRFQPKSFEMQGAA